MFYTVYKITNKLDGKFYIGSHKTKKLDDGYMGSGKYLNLAIQKYGLENFEKEILFIFDTPEQMYKKEAEIVNEEFLATQNTYNLKIGGFGGWDYINSNQDLREEKNKKARLISNLIIEEKYEVINPGQLIHNRISSGIRMKILHLEGKIENPSFNGKHHSEESKKKIGAANSINQIGNKNSQFGTIWIYSTQEKKNKKIRKDEEIPEGWKIGRKINF